LEYFWKILNRRLSEILPALKEPFVALKRSGEYGEPMDEADITWSRSEHEYVIQLRDRNMKRVLEIQRALDRLEAGEFGICVECGDDIAMERLEAHPAAASA